MGAHYHAAVLVILYMFVAILLRNNPEISWNANIPQTKRRSTAFILYIMEDFSFTCYMRPTRYIPLVKVSDARSRGKHLITNPRLKSYVWEYDAFIDHSEVRLGKDCSVLLVPAL